MGEETEDHVARWVTVGRARWPEVLVEPRALAAHLVRIGIDPTHDHNYASDLYLACACAAGDQAALVTFDRELVPIIRTAARRIDSAQDFIDEVTQAARERLLVSAQPGESRISEYAGKGSLQAWVRIAAMRIAMNMLRSRRKTVLVDETSFFDVVAPGTTDRSTASARYAEICADAVRAAFGVLSVRERNLLRMHHLHGLTVDELAPTFRVHRATVARWISQAREHLLAETRDKVAAQLGAAPEEVESILRSLAGQIDVTVSRLLAE
ncbi:MAG: sigma-70 family RNA polymerase sigma factor [Kofleriaceae bacterium]